MRTLTRLTLLLLILAALSLSVSAQDAAENAAPDINALAAYLPADTLAYLSIRTDDAYIDAIESLLNKTTDTFGGESIDIRAEIDAALQPADFTYADDIRSWLGDSAALAIFNSPGLIANGPEQFASLFAITDRDAAETFVSAVLSQLSREEIPAAATPNSLQYDLPGMDGISILITDDFLAITTEPELLLSIADSDSAETLLGTGDFITASSTDLAPAPYNVFGYINPSPALQALAPAAQALLGNNDLVEIDVDELLAAVGPLAFGLTIIDGRALVADFIAISGEGDVYTALGLPTPNYDACAASVDPDFARFAPANTLLYAGQDQLGCANLTTFNDVVSIGSAALSDILLPLADQQAPELAAVIRQFDLRLLTDIADNLTSGTIGLSFEEVAQVLDGQTFQAAFFTRTNPPLLEFSQVYENVAPELTPAFVDGLERLARDFRADYERSNDGALIVRLPNPMNTMGADLLPISILFNTTDDALVAGTRGAYSYAMAPEGDSLADAPAFQFDAALMPNAAAGFFYIGIAPLREYAADDDLMRDLGLRDTERQQLQTALGFMDSLSLFTARAGTVSALRLSITLAE